MLQRAFTEGYLRWEQLLNIKMGLDVKPMSTEQIWQQIWYRFNWLDAPSVPQYLHLTEKGLQETIRSDVHPLTMLVQGEHGQPNIPIADRRWIKVKRKYVGALSFNAKPGGFIDTRAQLRYLWEVSVPSSCCRYGNLLSDYQPQHNGSQNQYATRAQTK